MQDDDKKEFLALLALISEITGKHLSKAAHGLYWEILKEHPLEKVKAAVQYILKTRKFASFPQPADFIEFIHPPEELDLKAVKAVKELYDRACNPYPSVVFDDPILDLIVEHIGGWQRVIDQVYAHQSEEEEKWWRKEIERLYKMFAKRPPPTKRKRWIGTNEITNTERGYLTDEEGNPIPGKTERFLIRNSEEGQKWLEEQKKKLIKPPESEEP